jgi:mannose-6-phosphate isomerase-like protein (cupin superfamily)
VLSGSLSAMVPSHGESFNELATMGSTRVEHIISSATPDPSLQVQHRDEWVLVLSGRAVLEIDASRLELAAGDWVLLEAGTPHRVLTTERGTHWLAVHGAERAR